MLSFSCLSGFVGDFCEVEMNECCSEPCFHGAICQDLINGYQCHCRPGEALMLSEISYVMQYQFIFIKLSRYSISLSLNIAFVLYRPVSTVNKVNKKLDNVHFFPC